MTKHDIASSIAYRTGITVEAVKTVIDEYAADIIACLSNGQTYYQRGFGYFEPVLRRSKCARDIGKGKTIRLPPAIIPKFRPSDSFVKAVKLGNADKVLLNDSQSS